MTRLAIIALGILFVASCDKHSWETTQKLHEKYNPHGAGHGAPAGDGHKTEAKADPHAAPKAEAPKH